MSQVVWTTRVPSSGTSLQRGSLDEDVATRLLSNAQIAVKSAAPIIDPPRFGTSPQRSNFDKDVATCLLSNAQIAVKSAAPIIDPPRFGTSPQRSNFDKDVATRLLSSAQIAVAWYGKSAASVIDPPSAEVPESSMAAFHALQEWEGYVVGIEDDAFVARLVDLTADASYEGEEAVIPLKELSNRDVANIKLGSVFRWVIGYERSPEGTRKRMSEIVFRDLPRMTEGDLRAGREWAAEMSSVLDP